MGSIDGAIESFLECGCSVETVASLSGIELELEDGENVVASAFSIAPTEIFSGIGLSAHILDSARDSDCAGTPDFDMLSGETALS